jgi:hypothetical protein
MPKTCVVSSRRSSTNTLGRRPLLAVLAARRHSMPAAEVANSAHTSASAHASAHTSAVRRRPAAAMMTRPRAHTQWVTLAALGVELGRRVAPW